jgi:hypothetical protein
LISQLQFTKRKLEGPGQGGGMRWMSSMTGGGNLYKNVKENCMLLIRNLWGKSFW